MVADPFARRCRADGSIEAARLTASVPSRRSTAKPTAQMFAESASNASR
jgi:hypothetical protein